MTTTIASSDIHAFAVAVRAHLADLPVDDVDDLLDGLEADLADQADEAGQDFALPDAASYAAELRAAAGLPERDAPAGRIRSMRQRLDELDARAAAWVRTNPAIATVLSFFASLRPVWWVLRGVVAFLLLRLVFDSWGAPNLATPRLLDALANPAQNPIALALLGAVVVVSVQWGRGRWLPARWMRPLPAVLSVITAVALPVVVYNAIVDLRNALDYAQSAQSAPYTPGLSVDGQRVRNIFAYDAEGNPIDHVQLFDQNGQPLTTVGPAGQRDEVDYYYWGGGGPAPVAEREIGRQPVWNVFPLRELPAEAWRTGDGMPDAADATAPAFPFSAVPSVVAPEPDDSAPPAETVATPAPEAGEPAAEGSTP